MGSDLHLSSVEALGDLYAARLVGPVEVTELHLRRIERLAPALGAYITVTPELALAQAAAAERRFARGEQLGALDGIPISVKDLGDHVAGVASSFGVSALRDHVANDDSVHIRRLRDAGAVFLGKSNTPEFGYKGVTDNRMIGPARNPFDLNRNAGGSSGGAAAAAAAFLAAVSQGSDGGGSIRIPAANCGVFGFKASFGVVPLVERPNAFAAHAPFCHVGPLARSVADAKVMLDVLCGPDGRDPFSLPPLAPFDREIGEWRVAYSPDLGVFAVDPEVGRVVERAVGGLEEAGAKVDKVDFKMPLNQEELAALWVRQAGVGNALAVAEFRAAGIDLPLAELPPELVAMIEAGRSASALSHCADGVPRTRVLDAVEELLANYDVLACPTLTVPPVRNRSDGRTLGPTEVRGRAVEPCIGWCMTHPFNFTGHPAASLPAGLTEDGLPIGLQLVGRRHADAALLAMSAAYERQRPWLKELEANLARLETSVAAGLLS